MSIAGGGLLTYLLKILFQRPRPNFPKVWIHETDFSFPSGHAMMSILFYGFLAYFLIQHISNRKWQMAIGLCAGLISFLVGLSGLFLGVHYPTDGLGGWVMGAMWLALCISVSSIIGRSNFPTIRKQTFEK